MVLIEQILAFFGNYTPLISFFGAIIGGEETLIFLSILASHGFLNLFYLFTFFYLGILVSDTIWYFVGKSRLFNWFVNKKIISRAYLHWDRLLNAATRRNDFQALFLTKFLYGLRLPTIMYLSRERLKIKHFFGYSLITNFIWVSAIMLIGWYAGKGISLTTSISNNIVLYLILVGIVLLMFTLFIRLLSEATKKWLKNKQKQ